MPKPRVKYSFKPFTIEQLEEIAEGWRVCYEDWDAPKYENVWAEQNKYSVTIFQKTTPLSQMINSAATCYMLVGKLNRVSTTTGDEFALEKLNEAIDLVGHWESRP